MLSWFLLLMLVSLMSVLDFQQDLRLHQRENLLGSKNKPLVCLARSSARFFCPISSFSFFFLFFSFFLFFLLWFAHLFSAHLFLAQSCCSIFHEHGIGSDQ